MLKKVWVIRGDILEYGMYNGEADWVLNNYELFEFSSYESALDTLRDMENGKHNDYNAVNLCIDYKLESVEEVKENEEIAENYFTSMAFI